ncbi:MAG: hypothetical protein Q8941_05070 [Bacteroidota bacterium]|nr:hypothetical protein [Bacteroidota bacterium]
MSDQLKQFIDDNREAFDADNPDPQILKKLKKQLTENNQTKKIYAARVLPWAAAVAGLIILSSIVSYFVFRKNTDNVVADKLPPVNIEEKTGIPDPVYAKEAWHFQELIGLQQAELRQVEKEQPELYRQFAGDINTLDSAYRILKTKLTVNPNTEMLLEAMIQNLQFQSDLLNRQLLIIREIKQKSKAHEKSTS